MRTHLRFTGVAGTFEEAQRYTRTHAKSFYFASHVLPREKRQAAFAVYAFCRFADNIADDMPEVDRHTALDELRSHLGLIYAGSPEMDPGLRSFRETVVRYAIPQTYFLDLFRGMEMDLVRTRYETFAELEDYCYCVASVVGLVMAKVFGANDPAADRHAVDLGKAMQLTNILRDIREDFDRGRIYLPQEEIRAFGIHEADLREGAVTGQFIKLMEMQIARACSFYTSGREGLLYLPDDGSRDCVRLMADIYSGILGRIETQGYDVFSGRAVVPTWQKLRIAMRARRRKHFASMYQS